MSTPLESLPNIGPALAAALRQVGIGDAETLRAVGALAAWDELYDAGLFDCAHSIAALAGAEHGLRKRALDPVTRQELAAHRRQVLGRATRGPDV